MPGPLDIAVNIIGKDSLSGPASVGNAALQGLEKTAGVVTAAFGGLEKAALSVAAAVTAVTAAITATVAIGVQKAAELQQAVANISTIKTTINTDGVFSALNLMQTRVAQSSKIMSESLYDIFSSLEVSTKQGLALVEKFSKGAIASLTDAKTFGGAITGELNAFKLGVQETDHLMDVFFNTVRVGVVTGQELAQNLGLVTQSAKLAGVSVEELGGLIAGVTKEGGPAAQSINNLNNLLLKLNTKESAKAFHELGIETADSSGKMRGVIPVLTDLRDKLVTFTEAGANAALQKIFPDLQARAGATVIMNELDTVNKAVDENVTKSGAAAEAYEKMSATFQTQSTLLKQSFDSILTSIGSGVLPVFTAVTASAQKFVADTSPLFDQWQQRLKDAFRAGGFQAWLTEVGAVAGELGRQIEKWVPAFSGWVDKGKTELGNALTKVYEGTVLPWVTSKAEDLKKKFEDEWVPGLVNWWNSAETQGKIKTAMDDFGGKVKTWAGEGGDGNTMFKEAGGALGGAIISGLAGFLTDSDKWLTDLTRDVRTAIGDKFGPALMEMFRVTGGTSKTGSTEPFAPASGSQSQPPTQTPQSQSGPFAAFPVQGYTGSIGPHWGVSGATGGTDIFANRGTPVLAANAGRVVEAGKNAVGGNYVLIEGPNGLQYYYAHLDQSPMVSAGQQVTGGQQIGVVGDSGNAAGKGTHLHFGAGYGIQNGADANGGLGRNFDAVSALQAALTGGKTTPEQAAAATDYKTLARAYAVQNGVDPDIFEAMIQHEHGFKTDLTPNSTGDRGIAQIHPGTDVELAGKLGMSLEDFWADPKNQLQGAALYFKEHLTRSGGDYNAALQMYNAGQTGFAQGRGNPKYSGDILAAADALRAKRPGPGQTLSVTGAYSPPPVDDNPNDEEDSAPGEKPPQIGGGTINPYALTPERLAEAFNSADLNQAAGSTGKAILTAFNDAVEGEKPHALETLAGTMAELKMKLLQDPQLSPEEALARYSALMGSVTTALLDGGTEAVATARTQITEMEQSLSIDKLDAAAEKKAAEIQRRADKAEADANAATERAVAALTTSKESAIADRDAEQAETDRIAKAVEGAKVYVKAQEDQLEASQKLQKQERDFQQDRAALDLKYMEDLALIQTKKRATDMSGVMNPNAHVDPQAAINQELRDKAAAHNVDIFNLTQTQMIKAANQRQDVAWQLERTALASTLKATILDPTAETARTTANNWKDAYAYTVQIPREAAQKWADNGVAIAKIKSDSGDALSQIATDTDTAKSRITAMTDATGLPAVKSAADQAFTQAAKDTAAMETSARNTYYWMKGQEPPGAGNAPGYVTASTAPYTTGSASSRSAPTGPTGTGSVGSGGTFGNNGNGEDGGDGEEGGGSSTDRISAPALSVSGIELAGGLGRYGTAREQLGGEHSIGTEVGPKTPSRAPSIDEMRANTLAYVNGMVNVEGAGTSPLYKPTPTPYLQIGSPLNWQWAQITTPVAPPPLAPFMFDPTKGLGASGYGGSGYSPVPTGGGWGGLGGSGMFSGGNKTGSAGLPGFASGVENFSGGWAMVGEQGPEPVYLPSGASVYPHGSQVGGGGGIDYDRLAQSIVQAQASQPIVLDGGQINTKMRTRDRYYNQGDRPLGMGSLVSAR